MTEDETDEGTMIGSPVDLSQDERTDTTDAT
jgi:hypothetical protein